MRGVDYLGVLMAVISCCLPTCENHSHGTQPLPLSFMMGSQGGLASAIINVSKVKQPSWEFVYYIQGPFAGSVKFKQGAARNLPPTCNTHT